MGLKQSTTSPTSPIKLSISAYSMFLIIYTINDLSTQTFNRFIQCLSNSKFQQKLKEYIIIVIEEQVMWYSPKNRIKAFIQSKDKEIEDIESKMQGPKVTYEEIQHARSKLEQLRSSQDQLRREEHQELKQVLKSSQIALNDVSRKKKIVAQSLKQNQEQLREMNELEQQLYSKKQKISNIIREIHEEQRKIHGQKQSNNAQILQLEQQSGCRRKELAREMELRDQLSAKWNQVKSQVSTAEIQLAETEQQNLQLRQSIKHQLEAITQLQNKISWDQLSAENTQLKIENKELMTQSLHHRIQVGQAQLQRFAEDKLILINQTETAQNIDCMIQMCTQSNLKKQQERQKCQRQISQIEHSIQESECSRQILTKMLAAKRDNLKQLKEKGAHLKSALNSIFQKDSEVLKLLAQKKVYEESTPITGKQYTLDEMETSDNFFLPNNKH